MVGMDPQQLANWIKCEKNKFVIRIIIIVSKMRETFLEKYNKAFVGLRSCDKVQTESQSLNMPTGQSFKNRELVRLADLSSWSVKVNFYCKGHECLGTS